MGDVYYDYLQEIAKYEPLSIDEQDELIIKVRDGDKEAFEKLFHGNLKLVVSCAKKYFNDNISFSKMDIIQEGNLGLINAIKKYDLSYKGKEKFSSYAYICIHSSILRAIRDKGYIIRIPVHKHRELKLYEECLKNLTKKLQRNPSIKELINELHMTKENILELSYLREKKSLASLNKTLYDDNCYEYINNFSDNEQDPLNEIIKEETNEEVQNLLNSLTEKEKNVLYYRCGFDDGVPKSYQDVADILNYRDRRNVYELEKRALVKLRTITQNHRKFKNN